MEERYEYYETLRERKEIARQKKKTGNKKKCTLPSDYLTAAQKKKSNGEIVMYQMGKPISWSEFRSYPEDKQKEYLNSIPIYFTLTNQTLAYLFGTSKTAIASWSMDHPWIKDYKAKKISYKERDDFFTWVDSFREETPVVEEPVVVVEEPQPKKRKVVEPEFFNTLSNGQMNMRGSAKDICNHLFRIFQDTKLEVNIKFRLMQEEEIEDAEMV